ncbi:unnamed protein product [Periconia digitata]|uniref:J domain-containing protein n=1 Tax=Periconia digitata TaxID=1303443 RepID=A0A9W4USQ6_9PLEO|nr:unnamed protein product [Periconia digitata]
MLAKTIPKVIAPAQLRKRSFSIHIRRPSPTDACGPRRDSWPELPNPSPYEVLHLDRHAPYHRQNFTELAKRYHPDRAALNSNDTEDRPLRLDRFRMVVDAHHILSDPRRREAYDEYGVGWRYQASKAHGCQAINPNGTPQSHMWQRDSWQEHEASSANQEQVFLRKVFCAVALLIFMALASWLQLMRAAKMLRVAATGYMHTHNSLVQELARLRIDPHHSTREGRIETFLLRREAQAVGYKIHFDDS